MKVSFYGGEQQPNLLKLVFFQKVHSLSTMLSAIRVDMYGLDNLEETVNMVTCLLVKVLVVSVQVAGANLNRTI